MSKINKTNTPMTDWLSAFADQVEKESLATTPARDDIASRISEIVSGVKKSSPYSTVSEAVEDYQNRIGLFEYRKKAIAQLIIEDSEEESEKKNPEVIEKFPEIDNYIRNLVSSQYGIELPAILNSVLQTFGRHVSESDLDDPEFAKYINEILIENYRPEPPMPSNLGKSFDIGGDSYNDNPLSALMPNKQYK